ncbi:MAG: hypothetical protein K1X28_04825 [Parachlamydiales bacterium]|nr:hypothetical protein [Parachlamydiales bacterium]
MPQPPREKVIPYKKPPEKPAVAQKQTSTPASTAAPKITVARKAQPTPAPVPAFLETPQPTQEKATQVATPVLTDAALANALEQEIDLNSHMFEWMYSSEEKSLITRLAIQLAEILTKLFNGLFSTTKTRPMTAAEELQLADLAKRLKKAHELTGNAAKVQQAAHELANAELRAKVKKKNEENREALKAKIQTFEEWAQIPRNDGLRGACGQWTTEGARKEAAKMRVELATDYARELTAYPKLYKPSLEAIVKAKTDLLVHLKPDTREQLSTAREIRELGAEIQKLNTLEAAYARIQLALAAAKEVVGDPKTLKLRIEDLIKAKAALLGVLTPNSPEHVRIGQEINDLKVELERLKRIR